MLAIRFAGREVTAIGEKISWSEQMSLASINLIAMSSTERFKVACSITQDKC